MDGSPWIQTQVAVYKFMYVMCVGSQSDFAGYYTDYPAMLFGSLAVTTSVIYCNVQSMHLIGCTTGL